MTFDLDAALRKKEERASARLVDLDFRCRVQATRLLAELLGLDPAIARNSSLSAGTRRRTASPDPEPRPPLADYLRQSNKELPPCFVRY